MAPEADYRVDLDIYDGPLDLLLYLIREREMSIHDIPISEITEQFMAHLEAIRAIDIDRAGDFLLMAATLMLIKSRMLLPRQEQEGEEGEDDLDPRTDLVQQLLEYKRFKDLSRTLSAAEAERIRLHEGRLAPEEPEGVDAGKLLQDIGVDDLLLAFERLMRETLSDVDHQIFGVTLPLREVAAGIIDKIRAAGAPVLFLDFFGERRDRYYIVSVFLSLLEMLKSRRIRLDPGDNVADLKIALVEDAPPPPVEPAPNRIASQVDSAAP